MKKLFNNSTKGNDTQNKSIKSKRKFLKTFSFTSLALLMGIAGTMAFAPLGATSPQLANANETVETTTEQGLITPKADDPVIYTTKSGLDIKWGNALPMNFNSPLSSGNLKGFPYFTTTKGGTTYTWVIIGRNSNSSTIDTAIQSYLFSIWQTNNSSTNHWKYSNSFFSTTFESSTPAGSAIYNVISSKSYIHDYISISGSGIQGTTEIPNGCVLCLSNESVGSVGWSTQRYISNGHHYYLDSIEGGFVYSANNFSNTLKDYYTNDTFGFGTYLSSIENTRLTQMVSYWTTAETAVATEVYMHFFALGHNTTYDNFRYQTYLTNAQVKVSNTSQGIHVRTNYTHEFGYYIDNTTGEIATNQAVRYTIGDVGLIRPAFVMKL